MAKELIRTRVNCTAAKGADGRLSGFTSADAHAGLAVALDGDNNNEVNAEPHVKKTAAAADEIYGILEGPTRGTEKLSVITDGIVRVRKSAATAATDIGRGIVGDAAGQVDTIANSGSDSKGKGIVIGRDDPSTTEAYLYVDLTGKPTITS